MITEFVTSPDYLMVVETTTEALRLVTFLACGCILIESFSETFLHRNKGIISIHQSAMIWGVASLFPPLLVVDHWIRTHMISIEWADELALTLRLGGWIAATVAFGWRASRKACFPRWIAAGLVQAFFAGVAISLFERGTFI